MITLGQLIAQKRTKLNLKKIEFANLIMVGDDTLRKWERDRAKPAGINIYKLIKNLKFTTPEVKQYFYYAHIPESWLN